MGKLIGDKIVKFYKIIYNLNILSIIIVMSEQIINSLVMMMRMTRTTRTGKILTTTKNSLATKMKLARRRFENIKKNTDKLIFFNLLRADFESFEHLN